MATFGERFLLGFTSPRNPRLISQYVKVIEKYNLDGMKYDINFQELFYDVLSKEKVAGVETGTAKDKALAGRDKLTRMPQALGFFITQSNKNFMPADQWCDKDHTDEEYAAAEKKRGFFGSFCS